MSDIIRLLPDSVANQIAAGEVIQRPASVIKELVENAADAGATDIHIIVKDAGRTLIQVIDNGRGMSETDARMAFERHATSKISEASDLFTLRSMGFRGEALPSICAISQVELRTRPRGAQIGTRLEIEATQVTAQEPDTCAEGTSISVRNLFFNVPARRKFLKSDNVELANIMREFERLALVNNGIRMRIDTGTRSIDLMAGTFRQRIQGIWKNNLHQELVPVEIDTAMVRISGFVSRPEYARRRNPLQFLMVNGRNMRHPYFHKAILSCYDSLIAPDTQPCYFLKFEVDPSTIDINIHPTKNEIKFEYEADIWKILSTSVKSALGMFSAVPSIDFDHDVVPVEALPQGTSPVRPDGGDEGYNPFRDSRVAAGGEWKARPTFGSGLGDGLEWNSRQSSGSGLGEGGGGFKPQGTGAISGRERTNLRNWEELYQGFMQGGQQTGGDGAAQGALGEGSEGSGRLGSLPGTESPLGIVLGGAGSLRDGGTATPMCLQVGFKYIVTAMGDGLAVVDQHRAHVRILYERFLERALKGERVAQRALFPESVSLDLRQQAALGEVAEELAAMGYELEKEDDDNWRIVSTPQAERGLAPARDIVLRLLDSVAEETANYGRDAMPRQALTERTALLMARSAAITGGRRLSAEEMEHLLGELFRLKDPALTPDGHRIYTLVDSQALAQLLP